MSQGVNYKIYGSQGLNYKNLCHKEKIQLQAMSQGVKTNEKLGPQTPCMLIFFEKLILRILVFLPTIEIGTVDLLYLHY